MTGAQILSETISEPTIEKYEFGTPLTRSNFLDFTISTFGAANGVPVIQGFLIKYISLHTDSTPTLWGTIDDIVSMPWPEEQADSKKAPFLTHEEAQILLKYVPRNEEHQYITPANVAAKLRMSLDQATRSYRLNESVVEGLIRQKTQEFNLRDVSYRKFLTLYIPFIRDLWLKDLTQEPNKRIFKYLK